MYIEGEIEMISIAAKDIPAGTATGTILAEVKASEGAESLDFHSMAHQHGAGKAAAVSKGAAAAAAKKGGKGGGGSSSGGLAPRGKRQRRMVYRLTGAVLQYVVGLVAGAFQALVIVFYQWIVDPAEHGTW